MSTKNVQKSNAPEQTELNGISIYFYFHLQVDFRLLMDEKHE